MASPDWRKPEAPLCIQGLLLSINRKCESGNIRYSGSDHLELHALPERNWEARRLIDEHVRRNQCGRGDDAQSSLHGEIAVSRRNQDVMFAGVNRKRRPTQFACRRVEGRADWEIFG